MSAIFKRPVMIPQAIKAGINGMKMLAMRFKKSFTGVAFFLRMVSCRALPSPMVEFCAASRRDGLARASPSAAVCARRGTSARFAFSSSINALKCFVTEAARPGPKMICNSAPLMCVPNMPSRALSFCGRSGDCCFNSRRRRVMQFPALQTFALEPTRRRISAASASDFMKIPP